MTNAELLSCLTDRPCTVCKFHSENGCGKWNCVFDGKPEDNDSDTLKDNIKWLIGIYQDEIHKAEEDRLREGISISNAFLTGKIGAYGKAVADLRDLIEGEN